MQLTLLLLPALLPVAIVVQAAANRFIGVGLELGGKDPAYVREDADLTGAVDSCVDGAFNAGQSCCGMKEFT